MKCPDCNHEIGRFAAKSDTDTNDFTTITCVRTGRKVKPDNAPEPRKISGRKLWKRKKSQRGSEAVHVL